MVDEGADFAFCVFERLIGLAVDLLGLERLHEAFGFGVVLGRAGAAHAGMGADLRQAQGVVAAGVLHAAIGVVDQVLERYSARLDRFVERVDGQARLQMIGENYGDAIRNALILRPLDALPCRPPPADPPRRRPQGG